MHIPTRTQAETLLKQFPLPENVFIHCQQTAQYAQYLAQFTHVQKDAAHVTGVLHDLGRWKYTLENGYTPKQSVLHVFETYRILKEAGFHGFALVCISHPLGGLTATEAEQFFGVAIDCIPRHPLAKVLNIADKLRPDRLSLKAVLDFYSTSQKYHERFYNHLPGLRENTLKRIEHIWNELCLPKELNILGGHYDSNHTTRN